LDLLRGRGVRGRERVHPSGLRKLSVSMPLRAYHSTLERCVDGNALYEKVGVPRN